MKRIILAVFTIFLAFGLAAGEASAKRLGGGKSFGIQRQAVTPKRAAPPQQATPAGAPATSPKRSWMGPIAGLAAGLGLAALFSHLGLGEGMANFFMLALLVLAVFFVFRLLFRRASPAASQPGMQYAGGNGYGEPAAMRDSLSTAGGSSAGAAVAEQAANIPADFDTEGFVRVAKLNFIRLQAANDSKNLDDLHAFTSPELFAEIKMQMDERGDAPQQTDVVQLDAELLEVVTEGNRHIASVRFSGLLREERDAAPARFEEVWHLAKPVSGDKGWTVAGIQQAS